jgi:SAM-dependent methyltransferase
MKNPNCCPVCGGCTFSNGAVLWPELIAEWQLTPEEVAYIDQQQGFHCTSCGNNLRSMALADAILSSYQFAGALSQFARSEQASTLKVLEINEAGGLSAVLSEFPAHLLVRYPEYDMTNLAFPAGEFDLVIHSDTLEHVPHPVAALAECRRVLRPLGKCFFTVPVVVGRLTRDRSGLKNSFHGCPEQVTEDFVVHSEFGADVWRYVAEAGFKEITMHIFEYPAGLAIEAASK